MHLHQSLGLGNSVILEVQQNINTCKCHLHSSYNETTVMITAEHTVTECDNIAGTTFPVTFLSHRGPQEGETDLL